MVRFSLGREDDVEGPSSPRPKKQRITFTRPQQPAMAQHQPSGRELVVHEEEEEEAVSEYEEEEDEDEGESVYDDDEDDDEDGEEEDDRNEAARTVTVPVLSRVLNKESQGSAGPSGNGSISVTLTDPDVLDCPICVEALRSPVFQCENGHVACSSCCIKVANKCPACSWPIGYNRCRAIEKVVESVKVSCQNIKFGCKETVSYCKKHDHEKMCVYAPCSCPLQGCLFVGSSMMLFVHFSNKHPTSAKHFRYKCLFSMNLEKHQKYLILQERNEGVIFVLNNHADALGNMVNVICIGPNSSKRGFSYNLIARSGGCSLRLQSFTEMIPAWDSKPPLKKFLLLPSDFVGSCGQLKLELCIFGHPGFPARP